VPSLLPDVRQTQDFDCGIAALRCLFQYWERPLPHIPCTPHEGTHPATILAVLNNAGFRVLSGQADIPILKSLVKLGYPVITLIRQEGVGHYVVVSDIHRGKVYYQDPLNGPVSSKVTDFVEIWLDVDMFGTDYRQYVICAYP